MATNRTPPGAKGNCWPDSDTYARLQAMNAQLALIAILLGSGLLAWARIVANVVLNNLGDLVGIGTTTPTSRLTVAGPIATARRVFASVAVLGDVVALFDSDCWLDVGLAGGVGDNVQWLLPPAANCPGRLLVLSIYATTGGSAFYTPFGAETINGAGSPVLVAQGDFAVIKSDGGGNWQVLAAKVGGVPA